MALNTQMANAGVNAEADALAALLNDGYLRMYDGVQPVTGDTDIEDQVLGAELRFGNPAFGAAEAGVITSNALTSDSDANATIMATWARCFQSDGVTPVLDGSVGVKDLPNPGDRYNIELNSAAIQIHAEVSISSFVHTVTK
jgi:hypothetical protein